MHKQLVSAIIVGSCLVSFPAFAGDSGKGATHMTVPSTSVHMPGPEYLSDFVTDGFVLGGTVLSARFADSVQDSGGSDFPIPGKASLRILLDKVWGRSPEGQQRELLDRLFGGKGIDHLIRKVKKGSYEPRQEIAVERGPGPDFISRWTTGYVFGQGYVSGEKTLREFQPGQKIVLLWARGDFHALAQNQRLLEKIDLLFDPSAASRFISKATRTDLIAKLDDRDFMQIAVAGLKSRGFLDGNFLHEVKPGPVLQAVFEQFSKTLNKEEMSSLLSATAHSLENRKNPKLLMQVLESLAPGAVTPRTYLELLHQLNLSSIAEFSRLEAFLNRQTKEYDKVDVRETKDQELLSELIFEFAKHSRTECRWLLNKVSADLQPQIRGPLEERLRTIKAIE